MIIPRRSHQRSTAQPAYPVSEGTTTLAGYYDPEFLGGSHLQVLTEVCLAPKSGFPTHHHQDIEIISYILSGHLTHQDGLGHCSVISPGEAQHISCGTGITHSEYNASPHAALRFLQIWIKPHRLKLPPHYAKRFFDVARRQNQLCLMVSSDGRANSFHLNQDIFIYTTLLTKAISVHYTQSTKRVTYIHVAEGQAAINNNLFNSGDGAILNHGMEVTLKTDTSAEVLLFDLPYY